MALLIPCRNLPCENLPASYTISSKPCTIPLDLCPVLPAQLWGCPASGAAVQLEPIHQSSELSHVHLPLFVMSLMVPPLTAPCSVRAKHPCHTPASALLYNSPGDQPYRGVPAARCTDANQGIQAPSGEQDWLPPHWYL